MHPDRVTTPDCPEPTSYGLTKDFYPNADIISIKVCEMLKKDIGHDELMSVQKNIVMFLVIGSRDLSRK
jgi:hypothetical protein